MRISDWSSDVCSSDLFRRCIADAERRAEAESGAMNGRDPGLIKEISDEILVGGDLQALGRRLADDPASVWIHVESAFRHGTGKARRVVQHGDNHVAPLPECNVALFQKILRAIERSDGRRLTDRARIDRKSTRLNSSH